MQKASHKLQNVIEFFMVVLIYLTKKGWGPGTVWDIKFYSRATIFLLVTARKPSEMYVRLLIKRWKRPQIPGSSPGILSLQYYSCLRCHCWRHFRKVLQHLLCACRLSFVTHALASGGFTIPIEGDVNLIWKQVPHGNGTTPQRDYTLHFS